MMTAAERETIIRWDDEDKIVTWYTCKPSEWRKPERAGWELKEVVYDTQGRITSKEFEAPLDQLRIRPVSAEARAESKKKRAARFQVVQGNTASG